MIDRKLRDHTNGVDFEVNLGAHDLVPSVNGTDEES